MLNIANFWTNSYILFFNWTSFKGRIFIVIKFVHFFVSNSVLPEKFNASKIFFLACPVQQLWACCENSAFFKTTPKWLKIGIFHFFSIISLFLFNSTIILVNMYVYWYYMFIWRLLSIINISAIFWRKCAAGKYWKFPVNRLKQISSAMCTRKQKRTQMFYTFLEPER